MTDAPPGPAAPAPHRPHFLVLTGGPGAGKTAVLEVVRQKLRAHVAVLPESASILYGGGFPRRTTVAARRAAQRAIFHVQSELERIVVEEGTERVALCDRGVIDGLAYWPGSEDEYFAEIGHSREELYARYVAVIHLRTPPAGNGYDHRNPLRIETAREAGEIDARIEQAWRGHPRRFFVDSTVDFLEKLTRAVALIRQEIPACCREPVHVHA